MVRCHKLYKPNSVPLPDDELHFPRALDRKIANYSYYYLRRDDEEAKIRGQYILSLRKDIAIIVEQMKHISNNPVIPPGRIDFVKLQNQKRIAIKMRSIRLLEQLPIFCYIILIRTPLADKEHDEAVARNNTTRVITKGYIENNESRLVDLRTCIPSYY